MFYSIISACEDDSFCNNHGTCSYDLHRPTCQCEEGERLSIRVLSAKLDKISLQLTLLHSEWPKLHGVLAVLSAIWLRSPGRSVA